MDPSLFSQTSGLPDLLREYSITRSAMCMQMEGIYAINVHVSCIIEVLYA
jgi:hypothetical protein